MKTTKRNEAGQIFILFALLIIGLIAVVGLAVDSGRVFLNRADLSHRVDAAALAGALFLPNTAMAESKAREYLALAQITSSTAHSINITFRSLYTDDDVIVVRAERPVEMSFLQIIGFSSIPVNASAEVIYSAFGGDQGWEMLRGGPGRSGFQACDGLDTNISTLQYSFGHRWLTNDGAAHRSTPATFRDNRMFSDHVFLVVGSNDNGGGGNGDSAGTGPKVYAWDTVSGATLWTSTLNGAGTKVRSSPLIAIVSGMNNGYPVVFVSGHNGVVYALDARNGSLIWETPNDNDDFEGDGGYRSSVALWDESGNPFIYQATSRGNVYKINAQSGAIVWRSTPFPGSHPYENAGVPENWSTNSWGNSPGNTEDYWGFTPIYGTINLTEIPGMGLVVIVTAHGKTEWGPKIGAVHAFAIDASNGHKIWASESMEVGGKIPNSRDSAAVGEIDTNSDGSPDAWRVFVAPTDGYLYSLDATTGVQIFSAWTGHKHHRSDPIIYCDIVFGGNDLGIWALTAAGGYSIWDTTDSDGGGPDQANPFWNSTDYDADGVRIIPGGVKSAPAIVNGLILLGANETSTGGSGGSLWALETRTGVDKGHWDTSDYDPALGIGLGPAPAPGGANGDVRSGIVVADDFNAYFGALDTGIYQVHITSVVILIH